jgi:hypothetical protein
MNIDFQEILKELEFRLPNGIINLNEEHQVTTLVEILRESGVSDANELAQRARVIFGYVNEADTVVVNKKTGNVYPVKTVDPGRHKVATPAEIQKAKQTGKFSKSEPKEPIIKGKSVKGAALISKAEKGKAEKSKSIEVKQYTSQNGIEEMESVDIKSFDGYRTGAVKAPGTAAGAFPEVGGMLGAGYLRKNPNATDEELEKYLGDWAKKGKVTKSPSVSGGDKMTAAIHTARSIFENSNIIASVEGYDPKTTKVEGYWGSADSLSNGVNRIDAIVKKNPKATFNGMSADEYKKIIRQNGAGENPTDSMVMIWDGKSNNVSFLHISNKVGSNNIQANSSVKQTFTRMLQITDESDYTPDQKEIAKKQIAKREQNVTKLQKEQIQYQTSFLPKFSKLVTSPKILKEMTNDIYDDDPKTAKVRRGSDVDNLFTDRGGIGKACKKMEKPHAACKLVGKDAKPEMKVKQMFDFYKENPNLAIAPVREIISRVSSLTDKSGSPKYKVGYKSEVINELYGKMNDEVEKMRQDMNKIKPGSGDRMLAKDFASRLHLTIAEGHNPGGIPHDRFILVMGNNEADIWYDKDGQAFEKAKNQFYKVNDDGSLDKNPTKLNQREINRGNIATIGDSENFRHCLGVPEGKTIEEFTNVKYGKIDTRTGIQKAHIFDISGKEIGSMTVRSKQGPGGDAADTLQFSKGMQNCLQKQEYLKKRRKK